MHLIVTNGYEEMSGIGALIFLELLLRKPDARLGLATGSTPIGLYDKLALYYGQGLVSFKNADSVNLDEYVGLSYNHEQSYRYFMNKNLFSRVDIKIENTAFPVTNAPGLDEECKRYSQNLTEKPQDIQLLGLGGNGHIGFNEPFTPFNSITHKVCLTKDTVNANARFFGSIDEVPRYAVTMGISDILKAKKIVLLASGKSKAAAVRHLVAEEVNEKCPASALKNHPDLTVIIDTEAAELLH